MHGEKLQRIPWGVKISYACLTAISGLGRSRKHASIEHGVTLSSRRKPFVSTSLWVTVIYLSRARRTKSSSALIFLYSLNSKVYRCPLGKMVLHIDTDKLPVPVPDSTTFEPGRSLSLWTIIEMSGVYKIWVLCINDELYIWVFGLINVTNPFMLWLKTLDPNSTWPIMFL